MRLNFSINGLKYSDNSNSLDDLTILSKVSLLYLASFSSLAGDAFTGLSSRSEVPIFYASSSPLDFFLLDYFLSLEVRV